MYGQNVLILVYWFFEVIKIKIGYIRGRENSHVYKAQIKFLNSLNVEKVYHEKYSGNIELHEMTRYARPGDSIFIYSIAMLGKDVKSVIRFIMQAQEKSVMLYIKNENFDTSNQLGKYALNIISALYDICGKKDLMERVDAPNEKGRIPRELSDLRSYMKLVERKEMTVKEVCLKLHIGRTTYYRRCKELEANLLEEYEEFENETF